MRREWPSRRERERVRFSRQIGLLAALLASAGFLVLGLVQFHGKTATQRPVVPPYKLFWCQTDEDCAVVNQIGCCPCEQGGAQAAVTKWHRDDLEDFLEGACQEQQVCVQINLCREDAKAKCVDRRCRIDF